MDFVNAGLFFHWVWTPLEVASVLVLGTGYGLGVCRARSLGHHVEPARILLWYAAGILPLFVATGMGWQRVSHQTLLPTVLQATALLQVVPAGLALGDPLGLVRAASTDAGRRRLDRVLRSTPVRAITHPLLTLVLACAVMMVFVSTGWIGAAALHPATAQLSGALFLVIGLLFSVPMLANDPVFLPSWCTPPLRVLISAVDCVADSVPPLALYLAGSLRWAPQNSLDLAARLHDQQVSGALMFCLCQVVGMPVVVGAAFQWFADHNRRARDLDLELDAAEAAGTLDLKQSWAATGTPDDAEDERYQRPWWELNN